MAISHLTMVQSLVGGQGLPWLGEKIHSGRKLLWGVAVATYLRGMRSSAGLIAMKRSCLARTSVLLLLGLCSCTESARFAKGKSQGKRGGEPQDRSAFSIS